MSLCRHQTLWIFAVLTALLIPAQGWAQSTAPILVCYPGGPVKDKEANNAMASMLRVVEKVGQWKSGSLSSQFTTKAEECKKLLADKKPSFAITSLGLYLELKDKYNLIPVVQPKIQGSTVDIYRVLVQKGKFKSLEELKGKSLSGTVLDEPAFLGRIVFAGKLDPASFFSLKKSNQALRALRSLDKGEIDAVIVNTQQFTAMGSLPFAANLEAVFTSDSIPLMGVVANERSSTPEERTRFAKALSGMCVDPEGKKLCDLFGVEAFATVDSKVFEPVAKLWAAGGKP